MRPRCRRCLRPEPFCVCALLPAVTPRTQVLLLQHPREARLAICSAWLCHVALTGSRLVRGIRLDDLPEVREAIAAGGAALLFPGAGATPAGALASSPPRTLLVIDGTWPQASKMLRVSPAVAALPRVAIEAAAPSGYAGLRAEPAEGHLATIDAVAEALGALEGAPEKYAPMRVAFRRAVELQLECASGARRNPRHRPAWRAPAG